MSQEKEQEPQETKEELKVTVEDAEAGLNILLNQFADPTRVKAFKEKAQEFSLAFEEDWTQNTLFMKWATAGDIGVELVERFKYKNEVTQHMAFFAAVKGLTSPTLTETRKNIRKLFGDEY